MVLGSRIPDPGVKKAPDPESRIRIRNTASHVQIFFNQGGQTNGQCPKLRPYYMFCLLLLTKFRAIHQSSATLENFKKLRKKAICHRFNETGGTP